MKNPFWLAAGWKCRATLWQSDTKGLVWLLKNKHELWPDFSNVNSWQQQLMQLRIWGCKIIGTSKMFENQATFLWFWFWFDCWQQQLMQLRIQSTLNTEFSDFPLITSWVTLWYQGITISHFFLWPKFTIYQAVDSRCLF